MVYPALTRGSQKGFPSWNVIEGRIHHCVRIVFSPGTKYHPDSGPIQQRDDPLSVNWTWS